MTNREVYLANSVWPVAPVLARARELFGESLPELFLLTAVLAAVVGAAAALHG